MENYIKLSLGTFCSTVFGVATIYLEGYMKETEVGDLLHLLSFILLFLTIIITAGTGKMYLKSRHYFNGLNNMLCVFVGIFHFVALLLFVVAILKIQVGQYWLAALIFIVLFSIYSFNKQKNNEVRE
ncbi:lysylphosphatidylglycerol synthetase-like protein (DUF2156 family) [Bacillus tianshenii]|uniref:Lysylphosphatidylglycerol synthetase-like protein (DUF2156 family) n=1 Tax=Sutcliffiella tianshenii TaxID=1463404 RepID=A0ABS2NZV1_9BACI|nr:hypothetical protein [Bacillus tianshenii]MBM7620154.1 lysylphosphatidylglycerol synthetase-like protein (DUF2156 family) [Bacillus tianshenii]